MLGLAVIATSVLCVACSLADISLVTFDGAAATTFKFKELNDPVMGGKSSGTWSVNTTGLFGVFDGHVVDVPSLGAPGFIKSAADGAFPDASATMGGDLVLLVRSNTPEYAGFRVALASGTASPSYSCAGGGSIPFSRGCFKAPFAVPAGDAFTAIHVPFASFSDKWSPATGEQTSTCDKDIDVCPTQATLGSIKRIEVWAEGVAGPAHLELQAVYATPKGLGSTRGIRPSGGNDQCTAQVQDALQYGISRRTRATVPVPVDDNETLAEAVCCDKRMRPFAEPQFLYTAPDIMLFSKLGAGVTTFYDSVCGLPLFQTPVNRTLDDFKADTTEHGWPSFRSAEVFHSNVVTDNTTGYVTSSCGTHLGSYLPDAKGSRWCIDLSCIAGNKA